MLLSFFNLGAWGALYAYTPEQYPTTIRGTGAGMAAAFGRIGGILGPLLVGYLVASQASLSLIFTIFCGSILIGALCCSYTWSRNETEGISIKRNLNQWCFVHQPLIISRTNRDKRKGEPKWFPFSVFLDQKIMV